MNEQNQKTEEQQEREAMLALARELEWNGFEARFPRGCDAPTATDWLVHATGSMPVRAWTEVCDALGDFVTGGADARDVQARLDTAEASPRA